MEDGFYIVTDGEHQYGYFIREDLANKMVERLEEDACDPDNIHFYVWHYMFDDFYWAE